MTEIEKIDLQILFPEFKFLRSEGKISPLWPWYNIIKETLEKIRILYNSNNFVFEIQQIKSKFKFLCFYYQVKFENKTYNSDLISDQIRNLIRELEYKALFICIDCSKERIKFENKEGGYSDFFCSKCDKEQIKEFYFEK